MPRPIEQQVVVITGASSGIGRETARMLGERGASVVLAARGELGLRAAAREVEEAGGRAHYVLTDVAEWDQVDRLAREAVARFGRIDTWINNAGIAVYGDISTLSPDEMRRVVEVNLLGEMYGSKAAFEQMRSQDSGVIINVSSTLAKRAVPLQSAYCAAKHGVKGFTEALRLELMTNYPSIQTVNVMPSSINTPLFTHARSHMGVKPMPIPPIYDPRIVAEVLVHACEHPQPEIFAGGAGKLFDYVQRINPGLADRYLRMGNRGQRNQQADEPEDGRDNVFSPMEEVGSTTGDWDQQAKRTSVYTRLFELHPGRKALAGAAAVGATVFALRRSGR